MRLPRRFLDNAVVSSRSRRGILRRFATGEDPRSGKVAHGPAFYCANPIWIVTVAYTVTVPVWTGVVTAAPAAPTAIGA